MLRILLGCVIASPLLAFAQPAHRDPAPLNEEILSRVVRFPRTLTQLDFLAYQLKNSLGDAAAELEAAEKVELEARGGNDPRLASVKSRAAAKRQELHVLRQNLKAELTARHSRSASRGDKASAAYQLQLMRGVEERFERIDRALSAISEPKTLSEQANGVRAARRLVHDLRRQAENREGVAGPIPTFTHSPPPPSRPQAPARHAPRFVADYEPPGSGMLAMAGGEFLAAAPSTPSEAQSCTYDANDLASTIDAPKDHPEIQSLAQRLQYSPTRIYAWVYNEIRFEPYYGSLKGALATLYSRAGGPTDQASLLIALLRASNIPSRYVKAKVRVVDSAALGQNARIARWTGAKSYAASASILAQGKWPNSGADLLQGPSFVDFIQVFAEACVPYSSYRGLPITMQGHRWVPLDPSFKEQVYQAGIGNASTGFNYASFYSTYLAMRTNGPESLPSETFAQSIASQIRSLAPNFANNTLLDVPYAGRVPVRSVDILPTSLPYQVVEFKAWDSNNSAEAKSLPATHQYTFRVQRTSGGTMVELKLPLVALSRITLLYKGADTTHQANLDAWKNDGDLDSTTLSCTISVVPVIKVDGVEQTPVLGTPVNLCDSASQFKLETYLPERSSLPLSKPVLYNLSPADYHALQNYAFQGSDRLIQERAARLLNSVRLTPLNTSNFTAVQDEIEGEYLHLVGLKYMRYITDANKLIGGLHNESGESGNHIGLASTKSKIEYLFDIPFAVNRKSLLIDVKGGRSRSVNLTTGASNWNSFLLAGYAASAYESYIWQENSRLDAVSTVRGLQFAAESGIEIIAGLNSDNWDMQSPKFKSNTNHDLDYSDSEVDSIKTDYIDKGYTLRIPRSKIQYGGWKGHVYTAEKSSNCDDDSMCASFVIDGSAGGETVNTQVSPSFSDPSNTGLNTGYSNITVIGTGDVASVGDGAISNGETPFNTTAADPVNMVTGNMYHVERDIAVRGRGGLPIMFERSYNSREPKNGPLGVGWTHSFNHLLRFKDGGYDGAVTDQITSSVLWTDGTGSEKVIRIAGANSSGIPLSHGTANFTVPKGFYFTVQRNANGTYSIREKNGLTYTFESVAGVIDQTAKLVSIKDRNNNAITLTYDGSGRLASVSDGVTYQSGPRALTFSYLGTWIRQITDWTGRIYKYEYDGNGNLVKFSNPLVTGNQPPITYEYYTLADGPRLGNVMKRYVLPRGNSMTFEYYSNGRVFRHYNSLGETTTFTFNDFRRESVAVNERGHARRFFFDQNGNPIKIVEENGAERSYTYDCPNPPSNCPNPYNRLSSRGPTGFQTQYQYDANGNVTQITNPSGTSVKFYEYNAFALPGRIKDANGNFTQLKYSSTGNLLEEIRFKAGACSDASCPSTPSAAQIAGWTVNTYDTYGNLTSARRVRDFATQLSSPSTVTGPSLVYAFDSNGYNITSMTRKGDRNGDGVVNASDPDDVETGFTFDGLGRMTAGIRPNWHAVQYTYDAVDRVTRATDAIGKLRDYSFDVNGNLSEALLKDPNNPSTILDRTTFTYDASDRRIASTAFGNLTTGFQYDARGNVVRVTNPDGFTIGFDYDANNQVIRAADQANNAVTRTLDVDGRPRSITDPNGNTTSYEYWGYDGAGPNVKYDGRLKRVTLPKIQSYAAGRANEYDYDGNGNVTIATLIPADCATPASCGRATATSYDELNRPVRVVGPVFSDPVNGSIRPVTRFVYDNLGNVKEVWAGRTDTAGSSASDVLALQMSYVYDDFGRKVKETDALGRFWSFQYDKHGNLTQVVDAKSQTTTFTWNYGHQLATRNAGAGAHVTQYTRNHLGQVLTAQSPEVTYTYSYHSTNNRLRDVTDSRGNRKLTYSYSAGGLLNTVEQHNGTTLENRTDYVYDAVGRLTGIWAPSQEFVSFVYDAGGRLLEKWLPNGVTARYGYNPDNSLAAIENRRDSGNIISAHTYTYDAVGNRSAHVEAINGVTQTLNYAYDALSRLTQVTNGTGAEQQDYTYDVLGNRLTKSVGQSNPSVTAYLHDAANQLTEMRQTNASGALLGAMVYDLNGSLVKKCETGTVTITGSPASDCGGTTTTALTFNLLNQLSQAAKSGLSAESYGYDDQGRRVKRIVGSVTTNWLYLGPDIHAQYDATWTSPTALYTHGPNTDDPILRIAGTASSFYHADGLGSVVAMSDSAGAVNGTQRFDAWGNIANATGTINQYGYTGREPDATGLMYYRARYYDPSIGRFGQRDPIGIAGGINTYRYVNNNPVNFTDPSGTEVYIVGHPAVPIDTPFGRAGYGGRLASPPAFHLAIALIPNNPGDFKGRTIFNAPHNRYDDALVATVGGQPSVGVPPFGNVTTAWNYRLDSLREAHFMQRVETPRGMTDTQFINRIIQVANAYQNNAPYDVRPDMTGNFNSNSFVAGVLNAARAGAPALDTGGTFQAPGYATPIPMNTGGATGSWGPTGATASWDSTGPPTLPQSGSQNLQSFANPAPTPVLSGGNIRLPK